jgi:hypothetical protein
VSLIGTPMTVTTQSGSVTVATNARSIVECERRFDAGFTSMFDGKKARLESLWFLAWDSLRLSGADVPEFEVWLEGLVDVTVGD